MDTTQKTENLDTVEAGDEVEHVQYDCEMMREKNKRRLEYFAQVERGEAKASDAGSAMREIGKKCKVVSWGNGEY